MKKFLLLFVSTVYIIPASGITTKINQAIIASITYPNIDLVSVSPNNQDIAYNTWQIADNNGNMIRTFTLYMNKMVLAKSAQISLPTWSNSGKYLTYITEEEHTSKLVITDAHKIIKTIPLDFAISGIKWSNDDTSLIFTGAELNSNKQQSSKLALSAINGTYPEFQKSRVYIIKKIFSPQVVITPITDKNISISQQFFGIDPGFSLNIDKENLAYAYQIQAGFNAAAQSKIQMINLLNKKITTIPFLKNHHANNPVFSPDGNYLAYRASVNDKPLDFSNNISFKGQICITTLSNMSTQCLTNTFDQNPLILGWAQDNTQIYVAEFDYKTHGPQIYTLNTNSSLAKPIKLSNLDGFIDASTISYNQHGALGFAYETEKTAPEVYISSLNKFAPQQISKLQKPNSNNLGKMETISWQSFDNTNIEGILITPANYDKTKPYPLIVVGKGGPISAWSMRYLGGCYSSGTAIIPACWQPLMQQGFIIFLPNYRGSTGYGPKFSAANVKKLGDVDYQDIMSGIDYLIKEKIANPNYLATFGWSYDGYMTAWMLGQTNRFKAAVEGDGMVDLISFTNTTDVSDFFKFYFGGNYWDNSLYITRSPIMYTHNFKTPLLIMHGINDKRVPISQSYELNNALVSQHKKVKLIVLPNTAHAPTEPNIIYQSLIEVSQWLQLALPINKHDQVN